MTAMTFTPGSHVIYPGHGLGTVIGTKTEQIHATAAEFLIVSFQSGMTLRIPVGNVKKSGLRSVSSRRAIQEVFEVLREPAAAKKPMWRHRALEYAAKMKSGDPREIASIIRDLHRGPGKGEASFSEKGLYQQAWDHLIPEIAVVAGSDVEAAGKKVVALLEAA